MATPKPPLKTRLREMRRLFEADKGLELRRMLEDDLPLLLSIAEEWIAHSERMARTAERLEETANNLTDLYNHMEDRKRK